MMYASITMNKYLLEKKGIDLFLVQLFRHTPSLLSNSGDTAANSRIIIRLFPSARR